MTKSPQIFLSNVKNVQVSFILFGRFLTTGTDPTSAGFTQALGIISSSLCPPPLSPSSDCYEDHHCKGPSALWKFHLEWYESINYTE